MDLVKMIAELSRERDQIDEVICMLKGLAAGRGHKRPGRKPAWMQEVPVVKKRGRPPGSKNKPKDLA